MNPGGHFEQFLFGLCFGMGFCLAQAVLNVISWFLAKAGYRNGTPTP